MKKPPANFGLIPAVFLGCLLLFSQCGPKYVFDESTAIYDQFSGEAAFEHLVKLVDFGPKTPGSPGHQQTRDYLEATLKKLGWETKFQEFTSKTPDGDVQFFNVLSRFKGDAKSDVWEKPVAGLICSHYDTKQFSFDFVGANDGGSSTAALIEIARVLAKKPEIANEIELIWFDGEEAFGTNITDADGLYGSRYYAKQAVMSKTARPKWGVLLDMIGDADLQIRIAVNISDPSLPDQKAVEAAGISIDHEAVTKRRREIANLATTAAKDAGHGKYFGVSSSYIIDDHVPLNTIAGIPTIDIIDFDFDYWHTPGDTIDKVSAESLEITGQSTLLLIEKYLFNSK